jgi:hypothetical protein
LLARTSAAVPTVTAAHRLTNADTFMNGSLLPVYSHQTCSSFASN